MCNIVEEYSSKRYAEGVRFGERKTKLKCIKNLMQTKQLSALEAMDALGIDESDRNRAPSSFTQLLFPTKIIITCWE